MIGRSLDPYAILRVCVCVSGQREPCCEQAKRFAKAADAQIHILILFLSGDRSKSRQWHWDMDAEVAAMGL